MTQWKSPSLAVNLTLIQSVSESTIAAEVQFRSDAAPSSHQHRQLYPSRSLAIHTIAHIMPHRITHPILPLIPQLIRILPILCNIPNPIPNHPRRVPQLLQKALRLLCALLERRSGNKGRKTEKLEHTHSEERDDMKCGLAMKNISGLVQIVFFYMKRRRVRTCMSRAGRGSGRATPSSSG